MVITYYCYDYYNDYYCSIVIGMITVALFSFIGIVIITIMAIISVILTMNGRLGGPDACARLAEGRGGRGGLQAS